MGHIIDTVSPFIIAVTDNKQVDDNLAVDKDQVVDKDLADDVLVNDGHRVGKDD